MAHESEIEETVAPDSPATFHDLRPKMMLTGRVTKIDLYGAFVDIGIGRDALIHISRLKRGPVNRVDEVLSEGDEVTVWVSRVDSESGRVSLTMIKPLDVTWNELKKGDIYTGRITRLEQYGAFVEIGAERPGLIHVSEMGDELRRPSELFSVDQEVSVSILDFDRRKKRIDLTLAREEASEAGGSEEEEDAPPATAMEVALRRAFEETDAPLALSTKKDRRSRGRGRRAQDEILSRTLRSRKS
jgi:small subunit ribosomal protein S1